MQGTCIGLSRVNHFFTQKLYSISVYVNNIYPLAILSQKNIRKKLAIASSLIAHYYCQYISRFVCKIQKNNQKQRCEKALRPLK